MKGLTVVTKKWGPLNFATVNYTLGTYTIETEKRVVIVVLLKKQGTPSTWEAYTACLTMLGLTDEQTRPTSYRWAGTFPDGYDHDFGVITLDADANERLSLNKSLSSDFLNGSSVRTPDALIKELTDISVDRKSLEAERKKKEKEKQAS